jgi:hypothetical protein
MKIDGMVRVQMDDSDAYHGWTMNDEHVEMLIEFLTDDDSCWLDMEERIPLCGKTNGGGVKHMR